MTQEEKAKAYNEVLERAKKELDACGSQDCDAARQIFRLFPELKESEDDGIRKEIINFIKRRDRSGCDYDYDKWITWLEKQCEQKPATWSKEDEDYRLDVNAAVDCYFGDVYAEELRGWLKSLEERVQLQPKQEWNDEDEERLQSCLNILQAKSIMGVTETVNTKWLKSLKERYIWKPSDEQFKVLNEVLNFAANHENPYWNNYIFETLNNLIRQLKLKV